MAEGLPDGGLLHTIDINEELEDQNRELFRRAGFENKITQHIGPALELIPKLGTHFDLVFIDADKINYPAYYELVIDRVNNGGFIIVDNVLWGGKVIDVAGEKSDDDTLAIRKFNEMVTADSRTEKLMLPLRDGIYMIRKK
jgi:predicted O-methyltransferase YrrM